MITFISVRNKHGRISVCPFLKSVIKTLSSEWFEEHGPLPQHFVTVVEVVETTVKRDKKNVVKKTETLQ